MWNQQLTNNNKRDFFQSIVKTMPTLEDVSIIVRYTTRHLSWDESLDVIHAWKQPERAKKAITTWGLLWMHAGCPNVESLLTQPLFLEHVNTFLSLDVANQIPDVVYEQVINNSDIIGTDILSQYMERSSDHAIRVFDKAPKNHVAFLSYRQESPEDIMRDMWRDLLEHYFMQSKVERFKEYGSLHQDLMYQTFDESMVDTLLTHVLQDSFMDSSLYPIIKNVLQHKPELTAYYYKELKKRNMDLQMAIVCHPDGVPFLKHKKTHFSMQSLQKFLITWKHHLSGLDIISNAYSYSMQYNEVYMLLDKFHQYGIVSNWKWVPSNAMFNTHTIGFLLNKKQWPILEMVYPDVYETLTQEFSNEKHQQLLENAQKMIKKHLGAKRCALLKQYDTMYHMAHPDILSTSVAILQSFLWGHGRMDALYDNSPHNVDAYMQILGKPTLDNTIEETELFL